MMPDWERRIEARGERWGVCGGGAGEAWVSNKVQLSQDMMERDKRMEERIFDYVPTARGGIPVLCLIRNFIDFHPCLGGFLISSCSVRLKSKSCACRIRGTA